MIITVLTRLPYRWRIVVLLSLLCIVLFCTFHHKQRPDIKKPSSDNIDLSFLYEKRPIEITNPILGIDNFESSLPKVQFDFDPETYEEMEIRISRQEAVKKSFMHGWSGYKKYALGADELKPLTNKPNNPFGGLGATMIDSLSTMLIMGLEEEVHEMLPLIDKIQVMVNEPLSVFETIIRYMGGLISAYELYNHPARHILLNKAEEIGFALLPAFDTPYGIPHYRFNPVRRHSASNTTFLADAASIQLEFFALSLHTENPVFAEKAQAITDFLRSTNDTHGKIIPGLFPNNIDIQNGYFKRSQISFGAMGDSAYEYFLKEHIFVDGRTSLYADLYQEAIDNMKSRMLAQVPGQKLLFLPPYEPQAKRRRYSMDHLTCFVPGMLAMGSKTFDRPEDMMIAKGLLDTCIYMYRSTTTKLAPEVWSFNEVVGYNPLTYGKTKEELRDSNGWRKWLHAQRPSFRLDTQNTKNRTLDKVIDLPEGTVSHYDTHYLLRPETVESLYILYRTTGDPRYQEYGWEIYQAIENHCKTPTAYASIRDVLSEDTRSSFNQVDSMETFLFAETFKYLYLLFSPPDVISLDKFVFNTEAHPLLRRPFL